MSGPLQGRDAPHRFGEPIHAYTRAEAIDDGVLVDVTRQASPAEMRGGFTVPVALTAALWSAIEAIPPSLQGIADARGRLHDVLWMASLAARRHDRASPHWADTQRAKSSHEQGNLAPSEGSGPGALTQPKAPRCQVVGPLEDLAPSRSVPFGVHLPSAGTRKRVQTLRVEVGPDDHGAPCVTIGFPEDF